MLLKTSPFLRLFTIGIIFSALTVACLHAQDSETKRGRKYKAPPPTSHVVVTVVRATNGKPVENASVIFHPLVDGRDNGNMELKTNDEGKAVIDLLSLGSSVRLQIVAPGFQTYGEDYKVDKDNIEIAVKLKRPATQYSIYKNNEAKSSEPDAKASEKPKSDSAPSDSSPDSKPATPQSAPADAPQGDQNSQPAKPQSSPPRQ